MKQTIFRKQGRKRRKQKLSDLLTDEPNETSNDIRLSKRKKRQNIPYSPAETASELTEDDQDTSSDSSSMQLHISPPSGSLFSEVQTHDMSLNQQSCSKNIGSSTQHHQSSHPHKHT